MRGWRGAHAALEVVEGSELAFGGDDDLAVFLDFVERAGLGDEGGAQRHSGNNGLQQFHGKILQG